MGSDTEKEYAAFEAKVKRTVYLDNVSPQVNDTVIKTAFEQYGTVTKIHFIQNYIEQSYNGKCVLVELENEKQAEGILEVLSSYPFMMSGMPRPVRARHAEPEMFDDRPSKPGKKIELVWLKPNNPDFEVAQKLKNLTKKHAAEQSFLQKVCRDLVVIRSLTSRGDKMLVLFYSSPLFQTKFSFICSYFVFISFLKNKEKYSATSCLGLSTDVDLIYGRIYLKLPGHC